MKKKNGIFDLNSFHDLFKKCKHDLNKILMPKNFSSYDLFNIMCTFNHLYDWFKNDKTIPDAIRSEGELKFKPFKEGKDYYNLNQYLIREICNNAKHFISKEVQTSMGNKYVPSILGSGGISGNSILGGVEYYKDYEVSENGKTYNIKNICKELYLEWDKFIKQNFPDLGS